MVRLLLLLVALWLPALSQAATLEARVDRSSLEEGQTFVLELIARDTDQAPDARPLEKDFEILRSNRSSNLSVINGQVERHTAWRYSLSPKRSGKLTIPAITAGKARSKPLEIQVRRPAKSQDGREHRDVFLEVDVSPVDPWVQSQAIYRVRLFHARALAEGSLSGPAADGLEVQTMGEDQRYEEYRGGRRYGVLERRFALFPQQSGRMLVTPPVLNARFRNANRSGGLFGNDRTVRLRGERLALEVKPRPASYAGRWWLPASALLATAEWSGDANSARVGEPITRRIVLQAEGLLANQLPALTPPFADGFKIYPDQPELEDQLAGDAGLRGTRIEKWAIVPTREGQLSLPEQRIPWWNTKTGREEVAVIPAVTLTVLPAAPGSETPQVSPIAPVAASDSPSSLNSMMWPMLAAAGWLSALLFALMWWRVRTGARPIATQDEAPRKPARARSQRKLLQHLNVACDEEDVAAIEQGVLAWAEAFRPEVARSLLALADQMVVEQHGDLAHKLRELDAARYRGNLTSGSWRDLPERLKELGARKAEGESESALPPL